MDLFAILWTFYLIGQFFRIPGIPLAYGPAIYKINHIQRIWGNIACILTTIKGMCKLDNIIKLV